MAVDKAVDGVCIAGNDGVSRVVDNLWIICHICHICAD